MYLCERARIKNKKEELNLLYTFYKNSEKYSSLFQEIITKTNKHLITLYNIYSTTKETYQSLLRAIMENRIKK